ncbi:MAG: hypothetical protein U5R14_10715 [Gemmatimonadota bacterium]|nr:hypothetical protein [Gemmatimonadota bacterium]
MREHRLLAPVRQGRTRSSCDGHAPEIANSGLDLRRPPGRSTRHTSSRASRDWLGIRLTPAYVGEPECNGVAEAGSIRTLKNDASTFDDFQSLEEARREIGAFVERYHRGWLLQRHWAP